MAKDDLKPSPLEKKLREATKVSPKRDESRDAYLNRLVKAVTALDDDSWAALGDPAQEAANTMIKAYREKKEYPPFPDADSSDDAEDSSEPEGEDAEDKDGSDAERAPSESRQRREDSSSGGSNEEKDSAMAKKATTKKKDSGKDKSAPKKAADKAAPKAKAAGGDKKDGGGKIKAIWALVLKKPKATVDELFDQAKASMPDISKATIASARGSFLHVTRFLQEKGKLKDDIIKD